VKKPFKLHNDAFIEENLEEGLKAKEGLEDIIDALEPETPSAGLAASILAALPTQRFTRFANEVADLLDIDMKQAQNLLDGVDDSSNWAAGPIDGMTIYHVEGGPKVSRAITGFTRIEANGEFPEHKHLGIESILILQGYFKDTVSHEVHGPGDIVHMASQTSHGFKLLEDATQLTYLVVVQEGLEIAGTPIMYDSPLL
jgi:quercetin dioxygenase-like cupin family protein